MIRTLRGFTLIELLIVVAILVIVVVVAVPGILETAQTDNQQKAITSLRTYAESQKAFRERGFKKLTVTQRAAYARPFGELYKYGDQAIDLLPEAFAEAKDVHHPYNGYYFVDDPRIDADNETTFGLFAVPASYGRTGTYVYYVGEDEMVRANDPGEQITDPASYFAGDRHPRHQNATGWELAN